MTKIPRNRRPLSERATNLQQPSPFHLANLVAPAVDSIVNAISDRGGQTEAQRRTRADDAETLIMSFQPRDVAELVLAAQTVAFNELFADSTRDVLRGLDDTHKARLLSSLLGMGRMTQGHLDRLKTRGNQPFQTEVAAANATASEQPAAPAAAPRPIAAANARPAPAAPPAKATPREQPALAVTATTIAPSGKATPGGKALPQPALITVAATSTPPSAKAMPGDKPAPQPPLPLAFERPRNTASDEQPDVETSWLDEPYDQWIVETPAALAATRAAEAMARTNPAHPGNKLGHPPPHHDPANSPALAEMDAAAGD
jgi:hypothetical protein